MTKSRFLAFGGDAAVKSAFQDRLAAHFSAGEVRAGPPVWDGKSGTPVGCTVHDPDPKVYEAQTGYPMALAVLLDALAAREWGRGRGPEGEASVREFAARWLTVTPVGADLAAVPSQIVLAILAEEERCDPGLRQTEPEVFDALQQAIGLHAAAAFGIMPERAAWNAARADAIVATDAAASQVGRLLGAMIEAVCCDPHAARSFLADMERAWAHLSGHRATVALGWNRDDEVKASATLSAIWDEHVSERDAGQELSYPDLFAKRDPALHKRFGEQLSASNAAFLVATQRFGEICLRTLSDAPASGSTKAGLAAAVST